MVQLPATAAIEYVAAGHFSPGGLLAWGTFGRGGAFVRGSFARGDFFPGVFLPGGTFGGLMEFAGVDKAVRSKTAVWEMQEWTYRHGMARVEIAGMDNAAPLWQEWTMQEGKKA